MIITDKEKERWYSAIDNANNIDELKAVLKEIIDVLNKVFIQY